MRTVTASLILVLLSVSLAGCLVDQGSPKDASTSPSPSTSDDSASGGSGSTGDNNTTAPAAPPVANLTADAVNGTAPLTVAFSIANDDANATVLNWTLDLGDGNATNGTSVPANASYTFTAAGNYTVVLTLVGDAGNSTDTQTITVEAGASAPPPSETEFSSGPVLGCASDAGPDSCLSFQAGPDAPSPDGLWIELEPGHIGMTFTSEVAAGDSDGWIFGDDHTTVLAEVSNSGDPAGGVVPEGAKWILIVSWMAPTDDIVVTFTPTA